MTLQGPKKWLQTLWYTSNHHLAIQNFQSLRKQSFTEFPVIINQKYVNWNAYIFTKFITFLYKPDDIAKRVYWSLNQQNHQIHSKLQEHLIIKWVLAHHFNNNTFEVNTLFVPNVSRYMHLVHYQFRTICPKNNSHKHCWSICYHAMFVFHQVMQYLV